VQITHLGNQIHWLTGLHVISLELRYLVSYYAADDLCHLDQLFLVEGLREDLALPRPEFVTGGEDDRLAKDAAKENAGNGILVEELVLCDVDIGEHAGAVQDHHGLLLHHENCHLRDVLARPKSVLQHRAEGRVVHLRLAAHQLGDLEEISENRIHGRHKERALLLIVPVAFDEHAESKD
jgi:hypothetical protein